MLQFIKESTPGFGLTFNNEVEVVDIQLRRANVAYFAFNVAEKLHVSLEVHVLDSGEICQTAMVTNSSNEPAAIPYSFSLCVSLNRASYGQLTEGGPIPLPESLNI